MSSTETFNEQTSPDTTTKKEVGLGKRDLEKIERKNEALIDTHKTKLITTLMSWGTYLGLMFIITVVLYCVYLYLSQVNKDTQLTHLFKLFEWVIVSVISGLATKYFIDSKSDL